MDSEEKIQPVSRIVQWGVFFYVIFMLVHYYFFFLTNHYWPDFLPGLVKKFFG